MRKERAIIDLVERTLKNNGFDSTKIRSDDYHIQMTNNRLKGEPIVISKYVEGLLWSQLSAQRVWCNLVEKENQIDEIFANYNYEKVLLLAKKPKRLAEKLISINAGNRMIHEQMEHLRKNLRKLKEIYELIESEYSTNLSWDQKIDISEKYTRLISKSSSGLKLMYVGPALAGEFLKNIGIPVVKMDTHLLRILGQERIGIISCKNEEVNQREKIMAIKEFHRFTKKYSNDISDVIYLDALFWKLCAKKEANICASEPKCEKCLLGKICNYTKK